MIRLTILFIFFAATACDIFADEESYPDVNTQEIRSFFFTLWKDSGYGMDTSQSERAAWILYNADHAFEFRRWPTTLVLRHETWKGSIPKNMVGLVHTHPISVDPRPSKFDESLAKRIHAPIYTISRFSVWRVTPDGKLKLELGRDWFKYVQTLIASANAEAE
jgi:hypothetical protein